MAFTWEGFSDQLSGPARMQPEAQGRQFRVPTGLVLLTSSVHHHCVLNNLP